MASIALDPWVQCALPSSVIPLPSPTLTAILILKLFLVPALIYIVTLIGRRWGPDAAGWFSALPIVAGPILLTMALEQGRGFVATAAGNTLLAVIAVLVFCLAYAWAARRFAVFGSMLCALAAYAAAVAGLQLVELALLPGFALVLCLLTVAPRLFPRSEGSGARSARQPNDLLLRMLAGAALSFTVTCAAAGLGPRLSGFFAMFPVMGRSWSAFRTRHRAAPMRKASCAAWCGATTRSRPFASCCRWPCASGPWRLRSGWRRWRRLPCNWSASAA